MRGQGLGGEF